MAATVHFPASGAVPAEVLRRDRLGAALVRLPDGSERWVPAEWLVLPRETPHGATLASVSDGGRSLE